jgi:hypothetical protein
MGKTIRLTESDLTRIIRRVIVEKQENSEQCQKLAQKIKSHKAKGDRLISFAPKKLRNMLSSLFNTGIEKGPDAFKNTIPQEMKSEFQKKIATLKKPKSETELDAMILDVENEVNNIQEQIFTPGTGLMSVIMILCLLFMLVVLIRGLRSQGEYCGQSIWWG